MSTMKHNTDIERLALVNGVSAAVIAGAGTGKTTRLIDEITALVEHRDVPVERILAVTFSESAAADMKEKLRDRLESRFEETGDGRFAEAVSSLSRTQISTIHSLAHRMLRENPFEAGIDPEFTIEEESSDILFADETWRRWAGRVFWGGTERDEDIVMLLGHMSADALREIALALAARPDRLPDYAGLRVDPEKERRRFEERLRELSATLSAIEPSADPGESLYKRFLAVTEILAEPNLERMAEAVGRGGLRRSAGSPKKWADPGEFETVKRLVDGPDGAIDTLKEVGPFLSALEQDAVTRTAVDVLTDFVDFFRAEKRRRGLLSFFDMIWETKGLLERDKAVRRRYQDEFDYVLVDEFQDIDPILGDIVLFLAEDGPTAARAHDARLVPGKLFIVGDPKQSIYRFREADVGVFFSVMERIKQSGGRVDRLDTNYRSQKHLIDFQNAFFDPFIRHEDGSYVIDYDPLKAKRDDIAAADRAPAVRIVDSDPESAMSAEEVRRVEADFIAAAINELVEKKAEGRIVKNGTPAGDAAPEYRDVQYRDIAILFRSLSGVSSLYEEALKRAMIPYFVVGGRGYFQRQEIYDVTNILRAVFDPSDLRSLIGALRSPAFGIDDLTLYEASGQQTLSYLVPGQDGPLGEALAALRRLHDAAFSLTLSELLSEIYRSLPIVEVNAFGPGGAQRVGNLMKIRETARALESKGPVTLPAFLKLLSVLSLEREDEGEAAVTEEGKNAVRIMTIHASKGLEFPVVFVVDLGRKRKKWDRKGVFVDRSDGDTAGAGFGAVSDLGYRRVIGPRENERAAAEERRLLYVAATRARDRLILVGSGKEEAGHQRALLRFLESSDGHGPTCAAAERIDPEIVRKYSFDLKKARLADLFSGSGDPAPLDATRAAEEGRREEYERAMGNKLFSFVTEGKDEEPQTESPRPATAGPPGVGRHVGNLVHEVLAVIDLSADEIPDGVLERTAAALGLDGLDADAAGQVTAEARQLIEGFLVSDIKKEIASSTILGREVPLLTARNGVTVTGRIDVVYEAGGRVVVLDYKTDSVDHGGEAAYAERYRGQIAAYATALTDALKRDITIVGGVYFLRTRTAIFF